MSKEQQGDSVGRWGISDDRMAWGAGVLEVVGARLWNRKGTLGSQWGCEQE
jgi:hypothetical protein